MLCLVAGKSSESQRKLQILEICAWNPSKIPYFSIVSTQFPSDHGYHYCYPSFLAWHSSLCSRFGNNCLRFIEFRLNYSLFHLQVFLFSVSWNDLFPLYARRADLARLSVDFHCISFIWKKRMVKQRRLEITFCFVIILFLSWLLFLVITLEPGFETEIR